VSDTPILSLESIERDGCIRVASRGNITASEVSLGTKNPLEVLLGGNWAGNRLIVNLARTDFLDSTAIAWLIATSKQIRAAGGKLAIHSVVPRARQMLDLLKISKIVPIVADEAAARELINGSAAQAA
jgi:anti-anti-sigma factor